MRAKDVGWPTFDVRFMCYPSFQKEWWANRQMYHSWVGDDLMAKTLREKCVNGDIRKIIGNVEELAKIWDTLDTCYERS
jgi:hypothetical protein